MKYKKYPSYKDSGVEWLGDIPTHWNTKRLKNVIRASITDGPHETPEFIDEGVPFLSVDGIQEGELSFKKCRYISEDAHNLYKRKAFIELDDILLGKAASIGKVARVKVDFEFSIWSPLALIKPKLDEVIPNYLEYLLKSDLTQYQIQQLSTSNTQQNISMADIPKFNFSLPELKEQQQIANFLDEATAKIDTLIEKQTKQIELLKEKRQAVISHAVTKGINPNVPMKDSGVEWFGEIPENWNFTRLKYCTLKIKAGPFGSSLRKDIYTKQGIRVYGQEQVIPNNFNIGDYYISYEYFNEMRQYEIQTGDILISCVGTYGKIALFPKDAEKGIINPRLILMRMNKFVYPPFIEWFLKSNSILFQMSLNTRGGTMDIVNISILSELAVSLPKYEEQQQIANYLDDKTSKIDTLIEKSKKSIELLKEKRTALISACVTGKIDVRELV
jgi:type I restriction enzyme S subunit